MRKKTEFDKIKNGLKRLEFKSYFPIEVDDSGGWKWTEDALETLTDYIYTKIRKIKKYEMEKWTKKKIKGRKIKLKTMTEEVKTNKVKMTQEIKEKC